MLAYWQHVSKPESGEGGVQEEISFRNNSLYGSKFVAYSASSVHEKELGKAGIMGCCLSM